MQNPVLTEKAFKRSDDVITIGVTRDHDVMTVNGTFRRAAVLLGLMLVGAAVGWSQFHPGAPRHIELPSWSLIALAGAFVVALVCAFRPRTAPYSSPVYALLEGVFLGAISHAYDVAWNGIVLIAVLATAVAFAVTLVLYVLGIIRVTRKFVAVVVSATLGVAALYLGALALSVVGVDLAFWNQPGVGVLVSAAIVVIAAMNLFVDYEFIRETAAAGAPKHMEWYGAFGLMLTLVWLYLEMLRLLAIAAGDD